MTSYLLKQCPAILGRRVTCASLSLAFGKGFPPNTEPRSLRTANKQIEK